MSSTIEAAATTTADGIVTTLVPVAKTTQDIQQVTTDIIGVAPSDPANKTADAVALTTTTKAIPAAASSTTTTKSTKTTITPSAAKSTTASLAEDYSYDYSDEYKEDDDKAILAAALPTKATKSNTSVGSSSTTPTTLGSTTNPTTQGTIATTTLGTTTTTTLGTTTTTTTTLGTTTSTPSTTTATTTTTTPTTTSSVADEYSYDDYEGDYEGEYGEYGEEDYSYQDYDYSVFEEAERENQESYKELVDSLNVLSNPKPITRVAVNIFQDLPPGERPLTAGDLYVRDPLIWSSYNEFSAQVIGKLYLSVPSLFGGILLGVGLWSLFITLFKLGCKIKNYCMPKEIGSNQNAGVVYQIDANHHNDGGIVNIAAESDQGFCQIASQKEDGPIDAAEYTRDDAIVIAGKKTNFSSGGSAFAAPPEPHLQRNSPSSQGHAFSLTSSSTNGAAASSETSTWLADPGAASGSCRCGGSDVVVTNKNDSSPSQSVPSSDSIGVQTEWPRQLASTEDSSSSSEAIEMPNSVAPP